MPNKLDHTGDPGCRILFRASQLAELPDFVKQASQDLLEDTGELSPSSYADPLRRAFPCHTKAACFLSSVYFTAHKDQMPVKMADYVGHNILLFATRHGIERDVITFRDKSATAMKTASLDDLPDNSFAIVWSLPDGGKDRRYPLRNTMEVKLAADYAREYRPCFNYSDRQQMAEKILDKAAQLGASLSDDVTSALQKQAGRGICDLDAAVTMLQQRATHPNLPAPVADGLRKLARSLQANPLLATDQATLMHLAATVDQADQACGLREKSAEALSFPEDVLFASDTHTATQFVKNACSTATGAIYDQRQFGALSPAIVADAFGVGLADQVTTGLRIDGIKMAAAVEHMGPKQAAAIDIIMKQAGQTPQLVSPGCIGLGEADRRRLANEYAFAYSLPEPYLTAAPSGL